MVNDHAISGNVGEIGTRTCITALSSLREEGVLIPKENKPGKQAIALINKP